MADNDNNLFRSLPSMSDLLLTAEVRALMRDFGGGLTKLELRTALDDLRSAVRAGTLAALPAQEQLLADVRARLERLTAPDARRAINATGILLHTGLGRSMLCAEAIAALTAAAGYTPLQASLDSGDRSLREQGVERLLIELTGCEAATLVNNNAAATMLILRTLAAGKEVVISRGQLIEIGGAFRMPDVMAMSGATMREVGTTNRTHLRDYQQALRAETGAIIHVHTSNFRIRGFTSTPGVRELVELATPLRIPVVDDLGSGALVPLAPYGIPDEPLVRESLAGGAAVACFSADKLIGGPQAGIIVGRKAIIERIRKDPFARMFRVCKLTLAALEATLVHFVNGTHTTAIPLYAMLSRKIDELASAADKLAADIRAVPGFTATVADDTSYIGSGSTPDEGVPSKVVLVEHARLSADALGRALRYYQRPIFARLRDRKLAFDLRTLQPGEDTVIVAALAAAGGG